MAYNQKPPTSKFIVYVSARQGLGAHHFSNDSLFVNAFQTVSNGALNSLETKMDFSLKSFLTVV